MNLFKRYQQRTFLSKISWRQWFYRECIIESMGTQRWRHNFPWQLPQHKFSVKNDASAESCYQLYYCLNLSLIISFSSSWHRNSTQNKLIIIFSSHILRKENLEISGVLQLFFHLPLLLPINGMHASWPLAY